MGDAIVKLSFRVTHLASINTSEVDLNDSAWTHRSASDIMDAAISLHCEAVGDNMCCAWARFSLSMVLNNL